MFNGFFLGCFVICCLTLGLQLGATVKLGHLNTRARRKQFLSRLLELFLRKTVWLRVGVEDEDKRLVVDQCPVGTEPRNSTAAQPTSFEISRRQFFERVKKFSPTNAERHLHLPREKIATDRSKNFISN